MIALGGSATGLFSEDEALTEELRTAGDASGEKMWPLPLFEEHKRAMRSNVADLKNAGGRASGASTAAGFLSAFAGDVAWAHLDIAGTGWGDKTEGYTTRGASGVGVRVLLEWLGART